MPFTLEGKLVIAVSSRALFDFEEENRVFDEQGTDAFRALQEERVDLPAEPGVAFPLVKKLLALNAEGKHRVEVVAASRNDPLSGLRLFRSAKHHGLEISRGAFTGGGKPYGYLKAFSTSLFLSAHPEDVRAALEAGCPAATVYAGRHCGEDAHPSELRIAFDGDAVLFGDEAECIYQLGGIEAFHNHESTRASVPLPPGPFHPFVRMLQGLRKQSSDGVPMTIRTALVTSRNAPSHERAIRTLREWQIEVDEALFLGGLEKTPFLEAFQPDFFFDDQKIHTEGASKVVGTGHVPFGYVNKNGQGEMKLGNAGVKPLA